MKDATALPETLAMFPLPGALLLPRTHLPLHIFEPRYLAMMDDVLKTSERLIGLIQPIKMQGDAEPSLHAVGCAGRITQFAETDDNRYILTLSGVSRFRVVQEIDGFTPYRRCKVQWEGFERDLGGSESDAAFIRPAFMSLLKRFMEKNELSTDWETLSKADDELLINSLSMLLVFPSEDKQALLEAPSLVKRRETLVTLLEFALLGGARENLIQ